MEVELPQNIKKIINDLEELKQSIDENKKKISETQTTFTTLEKSLMKYLNREMSQLIKKRREQKPKGISKPSPVSNDLCDFMGKEHKTKIARTESTKFLNEYIKTNDLFDENDKKIVIPDEKLWNLIGDEAQHEPELTLFSIQKYLNKHFIITNSSV